jgi:hypothetical protein
VVVLLQYESFVQGLRSSPLKVSPKVKCIRVALPKWPTELARGLMSRVLVSRRITSTTKNEAFSDMSRRSYTNSPSFRPPKRVKIDPNSRRRMTSDDFKNGLFLAPMVRSGARSSPSQSPIYPGVF